jgi:glucuronoarabinoxylan endo-1,4-beta-xylanase
VQIYAPDLAADANIYDPCGTNGFLKLYQTYYWRVDENTPPSLYKGEVWSFKTSPYFVVEDFNSYENNSALRSVWKDGSTNGTSAEVSVETAIVRDGNSMRYWYKNNLPPYYSEAYVDIADLGIDDPDWLGIGAEALVLRFYGAPNNPIGEQMYVRLTDGDSPAKTATVMYGNMNDVRLKQWNKWSIALTEFTGVNLANVARITIGFGDGSPGNAGTVYFEDILLDAKALPEVTGEVDVSTVYQELEGFGAAGAYEQNFVVEMNPLYIDNFYDTVFEELGLDIYRLRNTYNQGSSGDTYINDSAQIVAAAKERNPSLKILISSWSPSANLKSNGQLYGGGNATLAKDANDPNNSAPYYYVYKKYAEWWADSLDEWSSYDVVADYVSMQNEPDYDASWDSCRFNSTTENSSVAGYKQAFEAFCQELYSQMGTNMPKLLPPETAGLNNLNTYINNLIDKSHVYGYAHHLYNGGGSYSYPDGYISSMTYYRNNYGDRPLMMTEFSKGGDGDVTTFNEAMNLAHLMHNALVFEGVSAYIYWELFWEAPKGLVSFNGFGGSYTINPIYYAFKHYSAFTDPGWHRVEAWTDLGSQGDLRISAFINPDNSQLTIVIINISGSSVSLTLTLNGFLPGSSEVYQSTSALYWSDISPFDPSMSLPAYSITTIHMTSITSPVLPNCDAVQDAGYGLTSDIDGDCYVNYKDLEIIAGHWLNTDCDSLNNYCDGADFAPTDGIVNLFDFSDFAVQWLGCNDPEDPSCTPNW